MSDRDAHEKPMGSALFRLAKLRAARTPRLARKAPSLIVAAKLRCAIKFRGLM